MSGLSPLIGSVRRLQPGPGGDIVTNRRPEPQRYAGRYVPCCLKVEAIFNWRLVSPNNGPTGSTPRSMTMASCFQYSAPF